VLASMMSTQTAASGAAASLLAAALDSAVQMNAQLLEAMRSASPAGVGGSVDTWA